MAAREAVFPGGAWGGLAFRRHARAGVSGGGAWTALREARSGGE